jgi:hypothetical protein
VKTLAEISQILERNGTSHGTFSPARKRPPPTPGKHQSTSRREEKHTRRQKALYPPLRKTIRKDTS